jgi:hypothetical protein
MAETVHSPHQTAANVIDPIFLTRYILGKTFEEDIDNDPDNIFTLNFVGLLEWLVVNLKFDAFEYLHNYFWLDKEQLRAEFE